MGTGFIEVLEPDGAGILSDAVANRGPHLFAAGASCLDDFFAATFMLISVVLWRRTYGPALALASWTFVLGNLYAMLFTRLEPVNPPDRPWMLLSVLVIWALISSITAVFIVIKRSRN